jgi:hypothetical protein
MIPTNAKAIIKARMQGFVPDQMILVSLIGRISKQNHTVHADPAVRYDWRWVVGLDICVYINPVCDWRRTLLEIRRAMPRILWLWDVDSQRGACVYLKPSHPASEAKIGKWDWMLDFLSWMPCQNDSFAREGA